jgi:hypothetical protein
MAAFHEPTVPAGVMFVGMDVDNAASIVAFASSHTSTADYSKKLFYQVRAFSLTSIFTSEDCCVLTQILLSFFFRLD